MLYPTQLASAKVVLHLSSNIQLQMGESITFSDVKTCQNFSEKTEENGYVHIVDANHKESVLSFSIFLHTWDIIIGL